MTYDHLFMDKHGNIHGMKYDIINTMYNMTSKSNAKQVKMA